MAFHTPVFVVTHDRYHLRSAVKIGAVRRFALSLPGVWEAPHFEKSSFRVGSKIIATVPPGGRYLHVFVNADERDRMSAAAPDAYEKLWWGKNVVGLRVTLPMARAEDVKELVRFAWLQRAPKSLVRTAGRNRGIPRRLR
jgi:hypothetical protein